VPIIAIPISILMPLALVLVPPGTNAVVAAFTLSLQLCTPGVGLRAMFSVFANGGVQFRFRLPDAMLALRPVIKDKICETEEFVQALDAEGFAFEGKEYLTAA
jgi:hypothetical protein